jgi:hypothetical protein
MIPGRHRLEREVPRLHLHTEVASPCPPAAAAALRPGVAGTNKTAADMH